MKRIKVIDIVTISVTGGHDHHDDGTGLIHDHHDDGAGPIHDHHDGGTGPVHDHHDDVTGQGHHGDVTGLNHDLLVDVTGGHDHALLMVVTGDPGVELGEGPAGGVKSPLSQLCPASMMAE